MLADQILLQHLYMFQLVKYVHQKPQTPNKWFTCHAQVIKWSTVDYRG
jgi:hypothetical protein